MSPESRTPVSPASSPLPKHRKSSSLPVSRQASSSFEMWFRFPQGYSFSWWAPLHPSAWSSSARPPLCPREHSSGLFTGPATRQALKMEQSNRGTTRTTPSHFLFPWEKQLLHENCKTKAQSYRGAFPELQPCTLLYTPRPQGRHRVQACT